MIIELDDKKLDISKGVSNFEDIELLIDYIKHSDYMYDMLKEQSNKFLDKIKKLKIANDEFEEENDSLQCSLKNYISFKNDLKLFFDDFEFVIKELDIPLTTQMILKMNINYFKQLVNDKYNQQL